jgi:hypothetical protein
LGLVVACCFWAGLEGSTAVWDYLSLEKVSAAHMVLVLRQSAVGINQCTGKAGGEV